MRSVWAPSIVVPFVVCWFLTNAFAQAAPRRVIIDTDPGTDDAMALVPVLIWCGAAKLELIAAASLTLVALLRLISTSHRSGSVRYSVMRPMSSKNFSSV